MTSEKSGLSGWQTKSCLFFFLLLSGLLPLGSFAQFTKLADLGDVDKGTRPYGTPVFDGTFLYGTTSEGGTGDSGTIYKIKPDGTGFTKLFDFNGVGNAPLAPLLLQGTVLYGTCSSGGSKGDGIIFKINTDGTGFTNLFDFDRSDSGSAAEGGLITDGTFLYGATTFGGSLIYGTLFKIKLDGSAFTKLFEFDGATNSGQVASALLLESNVLYGTSSGGGSYLGDVFKINTDGTGFTKLVTCSVSQGYGPYGSLIADVNYLYGMTARGGASSYGTIFRVKRDGTGFTKLVDFDYSAGKGAFPYGGLVSDGTFFYGSTTQGFNSAGIIFKMNPDGSGFTKLTDIDLNYNYPYAQGTLLYNSGVLYGVKSGFGGNAGYEGAIYKVIQTAQATLSLSYSNNPETLLQVHSLNQSREVICMV